MVPPRKQTLVQPLRERALFEQRFPRVVGYISDARFRITADIEALPRLVITPSEEPTWVKVGAKGEGKGAVHDRDEYYEAHRLQRTIFDIAAKITDDLKFGDEAGRRIMFPQALGIVRRYVETKLDLVEELAAEEIALGTYRATIESRLIAAIRPADEEGEQPLLPVLHDMAGIGTTDVSPFLSTKACLPTRRATSPTLSTTQLGSPSRQGPGRVAARARLGQELPPGPRDPLPAQGRGPRVRAGLPRRCPVTGT